MNLVRLIIFDLPLANKLNKHRVKAVKYHLYSMLLEKHLFYSYVPDWQQSIHSKEPDLPVLCQTFRQVDGDNALNTLSFPLTGQIALKLT